MAFNGLSTTASAFDAPPNGASAPEDVAHALAGADPAQRELMAERVVVVDPLDEPVAVDTKVNTHVVAKDGSVKLHRAFSVFWFSPCGEHMLLQQRASTKVTFPGYWTNACCSHPLFTPREYNPAGDTVLGVKNAAIRKLQHELGTRPDFVSPPDLTYMTRIHYQASSDGGVWGEHEIDYVLLMKSDTDADKVLSPNPEEVDDVRMVNEQDLRTMFQQAKRGEIKLTPWFRYITEKFIFRWWPAFRGEGNATDLEAFKDHKRVHFVGEKCCCPVEQVQEAMKR